VSEIEFALNLANQANMTLEELELVDRVACAQRNRRGMMLQDEKGRITYAEQKGEQKGESRYAFTQKAFWRNYRRHN